MEVILVGLSLVSLLVGALSSIFLFMAQPIWAIVDIAVSEKLSRGAKTTLLLLILIGVPVCIFSVVGIILIPLIAVIPFFYGCFFTASPAFRKATRISFVFFAGALIGVTTSAFLSSQVRENIQQFQSRQREGNETYPALQEPEEGESEGMSVADFSFDPFYAIHFVPPKNESIAKFTSDGADLNSATPFKRPSIYPLNHIAIDPSGPYFYGVTTHKFGKIDSQTGEFEEIRINDASLPRLSWPGGIAFDTRRKRIFITSRGHLYSYFPETNYWEAVADLKAIPIVYNPEEDLLYGLETGGTILKKINLSGAVVGKTKLSRKIPTANTWENMKVQILWSADKILVLVSKDRFEIYIIDPLTGEVV